MCRAKLHSIQTMMARRSRICSGRQMPNPSFMSAAAILMTPRRCLRIPRFFRKEQSRMYGWFLSMAAPRASLGKAARLLSPPTAMPSHGVFNGQIWFQKLKDPSAKPVQLLHAHGDSASLTWSPDGNHLAFVSDRRSHSFIGVYSFSANTLDYVDPGTDHRPYPTWSPDSREIAFVRIPYAKDEDFRTPAHRPALVHPCRGCRNRKGTRNLEGSGRPRQRLSRDR